uniref:Major facilitator superfamily MFS_1 n=1 Tax=Caulobacter sp. (strain K31) TaxID=366602 RepID=B0T909_CAUSK
MARDEPVHGGGELASAGGETISPRPKLRLGLKLGYAAGALLDGVATQAVNIFLFFYATTVCGAPAALAGVAIAAGLVVDALIDPMIGSASDACRSRFGRRLPFMMWGAPATALFLVLIFSLPEALSGVGLVAWITVLSICLRVSISLYLLPFNAVGAELSEDYAERSSIAAWRWGAAMAGALTAVLLGFGVFFSGPEGLAKRAAYTPFGVSIALVALVGAGLAMRALMLTRDRQNPPPRETGPAHTRFVRAVGEIFANPSFRVLFAGAILLFSALSVHSTLGLHANTYFWRLEPKQTQAVTLALFAGLLLGAPLAGPLLRRLEKRVVLLIGIGGMGLALAGPAVLRLAGLLPLEGGQLVLLLAGALFFGGVLMAAAAIAFVSMMADAADEHEYLFGARREGLYFAGWAFASKAAAGLGALIAGLGLELVGFKSHGGSVAQALSPRTIEWIGALYGPGAGALALAAAATCLFYRLDAARHARMLAVLRTRRAGQTEPDSTVQETAA